MQNRRQVLRGSACFAASTLLPNVPCFAEDEAGRYKWQVINRKDGVVVSRKFVKGREMPIYGGNAMAPAGLYEVLAVLQDISRHKEWMHNCHTAKLLKKIDDLNRISYNRVDSPWPVDDRDVVLRSKVALAEKSVKIRFNATKSPLMKEVDGVVRMIHLQGYYLLTAKGTYNTQVQYQVEADPGGLIPTWLAIKASEGIPLNSLRNLRKQVKAVKGQYSAFIKQWNPAYNPNSPGPKI